MYDGQGEVAGRTPLTREEIEWIRSMADANLTPRRTVARLCDDILAARKRVKELEMQLGNLERNLPFHRRDVEELEAEVARLSSPDLRVVMGYEAGQMAASAEVARLREALAQVRFPLQVAASYVGDPGNTLGMNIHAKYCAKALSVLDAVLEGKEPKP